MPDSHGRTQSSSTASNCRPVMASVLVMVMGKAWVMGEYLSGRSLGCGSKPCCLSSISGKVKPVDRQT